MTKFKKGDMIYNTKWNCFARLLELKGGELYHSETGFKMICTDPKEWVLIDHSAFIMYANKLILIQNENKDIF